MSTALFIGRFQPFHEGHLDAVKQILAENEQVIIGIGSSQESGTSRNPFDAKQRTEMITKALQNANISQKNYLICLIPDINNPPLWPNHVLKCVPHFDSIYTGSSDTKKLFQKHLPTIPVIDLQKNIKISATEIRKGFKK